tara:strand:+ start:188 stop:766 length:579 start_codon:yes stop_codon:yes gene_type:complete
MKRINTCTTIFMVPTLETPKNSLRDNGFINAYIKDELSESEYEDCIYVLFKPNDLDLFKDFLDNEYERTKQVIEDYDYEEGFVVVVYKLNKKFDKDFNKIKRGEYSKTSEEFQELFPKVVKLKKNGLHRDEVSLQYRVFNKTNDLIEYWQEKIGSSSSWKDEYEVWSGFNIENETLTKKTLNENKRIISKQS